MNNVQSQSQMNNLDLDLYSRDTQNDFLRDNRSDDCWLIRTEELCDLLEDSFSSQIIVGFCRDFLIYIQKLWIERSPTNSKLNVDRIVHACTFNRAAGVPFLAPSRSFNMQQASATSYTQLLAYQLSVRHARVTSCTKGFAHILV